MFRVVFWDILPCKLIVDRRFRGSYCLHHQGSSLEAVRTSETSVDNQFTRQYIPEDNSEHTTFNFVMRGLKLVMHWIGLAWLSMAQSVEVKLNGKKWKPVHCTGLAQHGSLDMSQNSSGIVYRAKCAEDK